MTDHSRCIWLPNDKPDYTQYHDTEWGIPVQDDVTLFEMLILEGAQAGLNWYTILKRRNAYRLAFKQFDPEYCAHLTDRELENILTRHHVIRHRLKVFSVRQNAQIFLAIQRKYGSFQAYLWNFIAGKPIINRPQHLTDIPASTPLSTQISKDFKQYGMHFVGPTIIYAYMQAIGMVNDHMTCCYLCPESP